MSLGIASILGRQTLFQLLVMGDQFRFPGLQLGRGVGWVIAAAFCFYLQKWSQG